ncbi:hypothetical protein ED733_006530 [Metarhizium rileyi]|uniref:Bcs1 n=1 Tax=Metarhizium rileyi (strain RCEF 4871) TaxID=1649241 RepID=A0A5C6GCB3_METRR|nr:hypothetical protein ED733_006530 [Metarhizium rileyi]
MEFLLQAGRAVDASQQAQQPTPQPNESAIPGTLSPQSALLSWMFPSYPMVMSAANAYVGTDFNSYIPMLLIVLAALLGWTYIRDHVYYYFDGYLMSSVTIRTDDEIYNMVMLWLSKQKFAHNSRHFVANTNINSRNRFMYSYSHCDSDDEDDEGVDCPVDVVTGLSNDQKQALHYTPSFGTHFFWYRMRLLMFERVQNRSQNLNMTTSEKEELRISSLGRNPKILKELLLEARQMHMQKDDRKTIIYRANLAGNYWQRCMSRLNRPFSTVILNENVKQGLIDDAADYLNPLTRRWYASRGIPYRRGYLLHGPPGTGKSSLSLALAGRFSMKIYIVSLSSSAATEEILNSLFYELPTRCIVLLEDIDSAGLTHTREYPVGPPVVASPNIMRPSMPPQPAGGRVSLSGLLNILDGVASQEGRILIMTTNYIEKLDRALIRPGRIDMVVPFGLADSPMVASIFRSIYAPFENEVMSRENATDPDQEAMQAEVAKKKHAQMSEHVDEQARQFSGKIPELEFSPAEVQGLLLRHKCDPEAALASAEAWVDQMRETKLDEDSLASGKSDSPKKSASDSGYETP